MRKIFAFIVCAILVCTMPIVAFAEEVGSDPVDTEGTGKLLLSSGRLEQGK